LNRLVGWLSHPLRSYNSGVMPMKSWIALLVCLCVVLTTGAAAIARSPVPPTTAEPSVQALALELGGRDEIACSAAAEQESTDTAPAQPVPDGYDALSPTASRFTALPLMGRWPASAQPVLPSPPPRAPARPPCTQA
jgi:hypothetical protein